MMSIYAEELAGREFDWFAVDLEGNIGLISTAGEGFMPASVLDNFIEHDLISETLEVPHWGSPEVWSDYANLGLYVYDWSLPGGPYKRERIPTVDISAALKKEILFITGIPKLTIKFSEVEEILAEHLLNEKLCPDFQDEMATEV